MKYLLMDTSSSNILISIIDDNKIVYEYKRSIKMDLASKILLIIDEGLRKCNIKLQDIDKIFIVNGPGSFTGVRIGVTLAKNIAWALDKKVIPISSLELMATTTTNKKYLVPMIDARRGNVFAGIYDKNLNLIESDRLISIQELSKLVNDDYELISYDDIDMNNVKKPNIDINKIINRHVNDKNINPHKLNPRYLKLTEAEENLLNDKRN